LSQTGFALKTLDQASISVIGMFSHSTFFTQKLFSDGRERFRQSQINDMDPSHRLQRNVSRMVSSCFQMSPSRGSRDMPKKRVVLLEPGQVAAYNFGVQSDDFAVGIPDGYRSAKGSRGRTPEFPRCRRIFFV